AQKKKQKERTPRGKNLNPSGAGGVALCSRDELVGHFSARLQPSGDWGARAGSAEHQREDQGERDQHEQRRIREGNLDPADVDDRKEVFDLKLMDGIHDGSSPSSLRGRRAASCGGGRIHCFDPGGSNVLLATTPAARITFRTPAAKPRSRNTIIPQGKIPTRRSSSQPMAAPTTPPATNSVESRKPRAIADGSAAGRRLGLLSEGPSAWTRPSRSP